eukprot:TRINITY_DN7219_c0_g1_i3.p1 TRINITY_DN7219_c0_g1~~TRINITY_DN7219_c0_g1_i3.p1  ORF type:complete len:265 (-),score=15.35 TRINITY_DN7219_c0_g1_i3:909-1703(-)
MLYLSISVGTLFMLASGQGEKEALIGNLDSRWEVRNALEYPWRTIGRLTYLKSDGSNQNMTCTGVLVGPHHVLTAAHCGWDKQSSSVVQSAQFSAAHDGSSTAFGYAHIVKIFIHPLFVSSGYAHKYDLSMMILDRDVGYDVGWMAVGNDECEKGDYTLNIVGYPADKQFPMYRMWSTHCSSIRFFCEDSLLRHSCDTQQGMSGAPLFVYRCDGERSDGVCSEEQRLFSLRGLHVAGDAIRNENFAVGFTPLIIEQIVTWIQQN